MSPGDVQGVRCVGCASRSCSSRVGASNSASALAARRFGHRALFVLGQDDVAQTFELVQFGLRMMVAAWPCLVGDLEGLAGTPGA